MDTVLVVLAIVAWLAGVVFLVFMAGKGIESVVRARRVARLDQGFQRAVITLLRAEPEEDARFANFKFFYDEWAYRRGRNGRSTGSLADVLRILEWRVYSATPSKFLAKLDMQDETIDLAGLRRLKERAIADHGRGDPVTAGTGEDADAARGTHEAESAASLKAVDPGAASVGSDAQEPAGDADSPTAFDADPDEAVELGRRQLFVSWLTLGVGVVLGIAAIVVAVLVA